MFEPGFMGNLMHSALRRAIENGDLQGVLTALQHGADIEETDMHGDPGHPLRIACFRGHAEIVQALIRHGADIHAPNAQGPGGPLRLAARGRHYPIIQLLIAHGAELPADLKLLPPNQNERRKRGERRKRIASPPLGMRERRTTRDRRVMQVQEVELENSEWERYFSQTQPNPMTLPAHDSAEEASLIFNRVRD